MACIAPLSRAPRQPQLGHPYSAFTRADSAEAHQAFVVAAVAPSIPAAAPHHARAAAPHHAGAAAAAAVPARKPSAARTPHAVALTQRAHVSRDWSALGGLAGALPQKLRGRLTMQEHSMHSKVEPPAKKLSSVISNEHGLLQQRSMHAAPHLHGAPSIATLHARLATIPRLPLAHETLHAHWLSGPAPVPKHK